MDRTEWENMIKEIDQYIINLQAASVSVGELFYDPVSKETVEIFSNYLTGFYDIAQAISVTVENSEPFLPALKSNISSQINELFSYFEKMQGFLMKDRFTMLADLLKYEVPKQLQTILTTIKELRLT